MIPVEVVESWLVIIRRKSHSRKVSLLSKPHSAGRHMYRGSCVSEDYIINTRPICVYSSGLLDGAVERMPSWARQLVFTLGR